MLFRQLFDSDSATYTYLLADEKSREAVLIDPVREQFERDLQILEDLELKLVHTIETHVHADHVSSSGMLRQRLGSRSVMSIHGGAGCADHLVEDGDHVRFGEHRLEARLTPGHTNGCVSFIDHEGRRAFTGDALLIRGCGRTDFQQGNAGTLYDSITTKLFTLDGDYAVYPGHDYAGRTMSTIDEEKRLNPRLGNGNTKAQFVQIMASLRLPEPKKMHLAVPANLECGLIENIPGRTDEPWAPIVMSPVDVPEVTPAWVRENLGAFRVIDVREPDEFHGPMGHVPGSELVPLGTVEQSLRDWSRGEKLVIVCRSGGRSGRAALSLQNMGFDAVASMKGGMILWNQEGGQ